MFREDYAKLKSELAELESQFNSPGIASDPEKMRDLGKRYGEVKELVSQMETVEKLEKEIQENQALLAKEEEPDFKKLLGEETEKLQKSKYELEKKIKKMLVPSDPNDNRNIILEIRAGAGGNEASLFAADLFRAYSIYSQNHGWKMEILSHHRSEVGGFKEIIAFLSGRNVYKILKNELVGYKKKVDTLNRQLENEISYLENLSFSDKLKLLFL